MAPSFHSCPTLFVLFILMSILGVSYQQPPLNSAEQESVSKVLDSINPDIPWRSLFPDDLCISAPHGIVCEYVSASNSTGTTETAHIVELSFGYVSDFSPNPPCSPSSTLNPLIFTSFKYLRKLFFYKCFNESLVFVPNVTPIFESSLEELVFIENPSLVGPLSGFVHNFTSLRRLVLTGNGVYGEIPTQIGGLVNLNEMTLSGNHLSGTLPLYFNRLKKLRVLDLSHNAFDGSVPESMGYLTELLKLDLSTNGLVGKLPDSFRHLQSLEFLDLSFNHFGNHGIPLWLGDMPSLREVYLSGNQLGGSIPEIWGNLGSMLRVGFSNMGLVGKIPTSMGLHLKNLCYLGLDSNKLEGTLPKEFEFLESAHEINLENNNLSGKVPFSAKFSAKVGKKLKLSGNKELCMDENLRKAIGGSVKQLKVCKELEYPNAVLFNGNASVRFGPSFLLMLLGLLIPHA